VVTVVSSIAWSTRDKNLKIQWPHGILVFRKGGTLKQSDITALEDIIADRTDAIVQHFRDLNLHPFAFPA
jgi:hypothetical protein